MSLPFELPKDHKTKMRYYWINVLKINFKNDNDYLNTWLKYINSTHCELCNKKFEKSIDRHIEHNHINGEIRNICCRSCNMKKYDVKIKGEIPIRGITKYFDTRRQLYIYQFRVGGKPIKQSIDLEKLKKFVEKWKKENNYYT